MNELVKVAGWFSLMGVGAVMAATAGGTSATVTVVHWVTQNMPFLSFTRTATATFPLMPMGVGTEKGPVAPTVWVTVGEKKPGPANAGSTWTVKGPSVLPSESVKEPL